MVMKFKELFRKSITFFDIDETLFHTKARVHVVKNNKVIKKLTNQEYNTYKLQDGEEFNYDEFKDSELFVNTSEPIVPIIKKLTSMFKNIQTTGSDMYLLTARRDFDNKEKFLKFLNNFGIKAGNIKDKKIHVIRAGNRPGKNSADRKKEIVREFLNTGNYYKVRLYDDDKSNLKAVKSLQDDFRDVVFEMFQIKNGKVEKY